MNLVDPHDLIIEAYQNRYAKSTVQRENFYFHKMKVFLDTKQKNTTNYDKETIY